MDVQVPVAKAIPAEPTGAPPSSSYTKAPNTVYARPRQGPYAKLASASKPVKAETRHAPPKSKSSPSTPTPPPAAPTPAQEWGAIKNACENFSIDGNELPEPLIVAVKGEDLSPETLGSLDKVTLTQLDQLKDNVFYPVTNVKVGGAPVFKSTYAAWYWFYLVSGSDSGWYFFFLYAEPQ